MLEQVKIFYGMVGPAGVTLILLSLFALYLSLKNYYQLTLIWNDFQYNFKDLETNECKSFDIFSRLNKNPLIGVVSDILSHSHHSDDIRAEVAYLFYRNFKKVTRDLTYLRLISVVSPLLGLLGTVLGMVKVFEAISASSSPDPAMLAAGISTALLTTIMGLTIAVPTLLFYYVLTLKFKAFHIEATEYSYRVLDICIDHGGDNKNE